MIRSQRLSAPRPMTLCLIAAFALQPHRALAQMNISGHMMETQDETPPGKLPPPIKMAGIGNVHFQITASPEAQMWFDQGLNLLHDFWDYESARAFEQSIRVDPNCAICYWGLYKAESFYHSIAKGYATEALAKAVSLKRRASKRERLYIETSAAQDPAFRNSKRGPGSARAIKLARQLVRKYPHDMQTRIFLAQLVDHNESLALLQSVLKEEPANSAANHYYIHALEGTDHPEQALHSAEILPSLAPASGHMVHMPGHIFFRVGDYARAEQAFTASMQVDERYMREQHVAPDNDWNYVHNLMYAIANLMEEGKLQQANVLSGKVTAARGRLESTLYIYSMRDSITRLDPGLPVALRTADWKRVIELLNNRPSTTNEPNLAFLAQQLSNFAAGMLAIETHDLQRASKLSAQFEAGVSRRSKDSPAIRQLPAGPLKLQVMPDASLRPLLNSLSIMSLELRASLFAAEGNIVEAKPFFAQAAKQEKELGYREPPNYIRPVGETEGAAMIAAGDWTDAKAAYERALVERPRSGFALYGIALSSEKSGDAKAAAAQYADFLAAWPQADPTLAPVIHARQYVAGHSTALASPRK